MNIFILHTDPIKCAQMHADVHVVKMILETAQMLCSVHESGLAPYRRTHFNHPCTIWARTTDSNYRWLLALGDALCKEYTYRYGRRHKSQDVIEWCRENEPSLPAGPITAFARAMPEECKRSTVTDSYRTFYRYKRDNGMELRYSKRSVPKFLEAA
jgi:hypothetical protein